MHIKTLIEDLEKNYNNESINQEKINTCISIINKIFLNIRNENQFFNMFIEELHQNFIIYFKKLSKDSLDKNLKTDINRDSLIKEKFSLEYLENHIINKINKLIKKEVQKLKENVRKNKVSRDQLTISGGYTIHKLIYLLNNEFSKNGHLESVSNYLGYKSSITGLAIELSSEKSNWWKYKKEGEEPKTLAVHLDKEFTCIKSILYLTEVNENNGPFAIYPKVYENLKLNLFQNIIGRIIGETGLNTKNEKLIDYLNIKYKDQPFLSTNFFKIYKMLPPEIMFNSTFGWDLKRGSKKEEEIIKSKKKIFGKEGTLITFDGSTLLHSGGLVKNSERIVLQIIYSKRINFFHFLFKKILAKVL